MKKTVPQNSPGMLLYLMESGSPLITAIIPVYNRPVQILEALESVLDQSYRPLEIIIGDDGSEDHTVEAVQKYLEKYTPSGSVNCTVLELDHTGYPGFVRNRCARKARGEYLAFLDSDDLWLPEKLSRQYELLHRDHSDCQISHTREEWNRSGKIISQAGMNHKREGNIFADSLKKCIIGPSTVMISHSLYVETGGFREDLEIAEDYEYWLRLTANYKVGYVDEPLTVKRAGHDNQLSEKYGQIEIFRITGLKDLVDRAFFDSQLQKMAARELSRKCMIYGRGCTKRNKYEEGLKYQDLAGMYALWP